MAGNPTNLAYGVNCRAAHPNDLEPGGGPGIVFCDTIKAETFELPANNLTLTGNLQVGGDISVTGASTFTGNVNTGNITVTGNAIIPMNLVKTINSAQLLDLHNTPVVLVPAPGANKIISFYQLQLVYRRNTTNYTVVNNASFDFYYDGTNVSVGASTVATGLLDNTFAGGGIGIKTVANPASLEGNTPVAAGTIKNLAVVTKLNVGGQLTLGDGTLTIYGSYTIEDLS